MSVRWPLSHSFWGCWCHITVRTGFTLGWTIVCAPFQTAGLWEESNGIGLVTAALVLVGLWTGRNRIVSRVVCMVAVALFVASFRMPNGWSLWKGVHDFIPGAGGLRAVGRIALIMLLPASIGLAGVLEGISRSAGMLPILLVGLEQGGDLPHF